MTRMRGGRGGGGDDEGNTKPRQDEIMVSHSIRSNINCDVKKNKTKKEEKKKEKRRKKLCPDSHPQETETGC